MSVLGEELEVLGLRERVQALGTQSMQETPLWRAETTLGDPTAEH